MKKSFLPYLALTLGAIWAPPLLALDLTPREVPVKSEGGPAMRRYFEDGQAKIGFRIDSKMQITGGPDQLLVRYEDVQESEMKIARSALDAKTPFSAENIARYRELARAVVPEGADDVVFEEETPNAISINGWSSYQFAVKFTLSRRTQRATVTVLNYSPKEQFLVRVNAPARDYERVFARAYRILNSMYELQPGEEVKPDGES